MHKLNSMLSVAGNQEYSRTLISMLDWSAVSQKSFR